MKDVDPRFLLRRPFTTTPPREGANRTEGVIGVRDNGDGDEGRGTEVECKVNLINTQKWLQSTFCFYFVYFKKQTYPSWLKKKKFSWRFVPYCYMFLWIFIRSYLKTKFRIPSVSTHPLKRRSLQVTTTNGVYFVTIATDRILSENYFRRRRRRRR